MSNNSTSKDSWFGDIPQLWNSKKIKNLFRIKKDIAGKEGYLILSITQKGILPKNISTNEGQIASDYSKYQLVNCGDFAMNHMDLLTGWVDISQYDGVTSPDYRVFVLYDKQNNHSPYYKHLFQMCYSNRVFYGLGQGVSGLGRWRLPSDQFLNFPIPQPPLSEQQRIADYLDAQCAKIDSTITKTQQIIEKLKSYKQSVITEAVTKGLNPDAPMKDSGIEWIGEIPEHWEVGKTRYALAMAITDGPHETPELFSEGIPFISAEAVSCGNGKIDFSHMRGYISQEFYNECCKKYIPKINDIYMIKSGATTGRVSIVDTEDVFTIWSPLAVFRCENIIYHYLYMFYFLQSDSYQKQIQDKWSFGTQQNIGMRTLEKLFLCFPPKTEQQEIASYLDDKCAKIDECISKKQEVIEKLTAYKKSLIFEVVTGKKEI